MLEIQAMWFDNDGGLKVQEAESTVGYNVWEVGRVQIMESYVLLYVALTLL